MGIPAFYRWLIDCYPRSVVDVLEDSPPVVNGVRMPVDATKPNPNGAEFDNLYLDMNGIIHPCFHPENGPPPKSYDEVFAAVFKYIDRIFSLIRPRKVMFMAIDGVAPRAKMNQQRARRFRAAKDAADAASLLEKQGCDHAEKDTSLLDSNLITPGTGFMESLSSALQFYVHLRINADPSWKGVKVILSDATVPGEGEHKIMSYIRLQRNLPGFDPNTRHCLYGLDADLIMLALATHEVHFSVLREDVRRVPPKVTGHNINKRTRNGIMKPNEPTSEFLEDIISKQKFQFLNVWILRDYLAESLRIPDPSVKVDLERLIDDFVFMCLFVGNDFLPHVPSLEISEGAIDLLMSVYKKEFVRMGGYLTHATEVNLKGVEHFVQTLGSHENAIFKKRRQEQISWERHARHFPAKTKDQSSSTPDASIVVDKVNLGEEGWKERYYVEKFEVQSDVDRERVKNHAVLKYVEGICWVMHYYYQGVCSWQWFYPYHYAPFASDFQGLDTLNIHFDLGKPFKPFDQLMGVLPAASSGALPLSYRKLMTDQSSPILDLYPTEFGLDLNGRKQAWKAICKLPFIDEARLLCEIAKVENTLTDVERRRNTLGIDKLFFDMSHPLAAKIFIFLERNKDNPKLQKAKVKTRINPKLSGGMNGYVYVSDQPVCIPEIPSPLTDMKTITNNKVLAVLYKFPDLHPHIPRPPKGVKMPPKTIGRHDLPLTPSLWHEKSAISMSRFTSRPIPPQSIAGSSLAKISHQIVSGTFNSQNGGNVAKIHQQLVSGFDSSEKGGCAAKVPHQLVSKNGEKKKKKKKRKKRPISPESIAGSCPDQLVSGIHHSEDRGNVANMPHQLVSGIVSSEDQSNINKQSNDAHNQSEDGGTMANIAQQLVSGIFSGEDQSKINKHSDDAHNQSDDGGKMANISQQLVSGTNGSEDLGNVNKQSHDALNQSGEKKKKKRRKKRPISPESIAGSCPDQLVSGTVSSEDQSNINKQSNDAHNQSEDGGKMANISQQLDSGIFSSEVQSNINKQSIDTHNQSEDGGKIANISQQLDSGIFSSEDQSNINKQSIDAHNQSEDGEKMANISQQLDSGIFSSEDQSNINKQSIDAYNQSEDGEKMANISQQLVSGIFSSEDASNMNKQSNDAHNQSEDGGKMANISQQLVSGIFSSEDQSDINKQSIAAHNLGEDGGKMANISQQLVSGIFSSEDQSDINKQSNDAHNRGEDGGKMANISQQLDSGIQSSEEKGGVNQQSHDSLNQSGEKKSRKKKRNDAHNRGEDGGKMADISHQLVSGIQSNEEKGDVNQQSHDSLNQSGEKKRRKKKRKLNAAAEEFQPSVAPPLNHL